MMVHVLGRERRWIRESVSVTCSHELEGKGLWGGGFLYHHLINILSEFDACMAKLVSPCIYVYSHLVCIQGEANKRPKM